MQQVCRAGERTLRHSAFLLLCDCVVSAAEQHECNMQASLQACQAPGLHDLLMQQHASQPAVVLACQGARATRQRSPGFLWEEEKGVC